MSPYAFTKSKNLKLLIHLRKWFGFNYEAIYFYNVYGPKQIRVGNMATVIGIFEKQFLDKKALTEWGEILKSKKNLRLIKIKYKNIVESIKRMD